MSLKSFVNNKVEWDAFNEELDDMISLYHKGLEGISDTVEIYRTQGSIRTLKQLKYLREKANAPR
jgi:hypothetical protein|tara:strand:+ start:112 stop:306 length:195 start_codon:yes stop_codon:yes gene_type:complete